MIIAISGTGGSGKSTLAKRLARELNYTHYSMGDLQREVAKEKGVSIIELGELEKTDPTIDKMIDQKQVKLGEERDNFVIDGWLTAKFLPRAVKIFLDADINARANRVMGERESEKYSDFQEAVSSTAKREKTNQERWIEFYNFDFKDKSNYDLVVDTSSVNTGQVFEKVWKYIQSL